MPVKTKRSTVESTTTKSAKAPKTVTITTAKAKSAKAGIGKPTAAKKGDAKPVAGNGPVVRTVSGIKTINLALQGGGSHGAFTWGVLDRLLEEERLWIEGISGTSAGALNGAILAQGFVKRVGRQGAKDELDYFWTKVSELARFSPVHRSAFDHVLGNWNIDGSPGALWLDLVERLFSPYQLNPMNLNPLRDLLTDHLDIAAIRACDPLKLFVCATNVETGHARVFMRHELSIEALLASACLPFTFQAVEIDGVPYWDGGYMGNPVIFPLIYYCDSRDVAIVQINPLVRKGTPRSAPEIANRLNEISFNSALIAEMRAIAFVQRLVQGKHLKGKDAVRLKHMHIHMIGNEEKMRALGVTSKMNADIDFLLYMKELGRTTAEDWLKTNWDAIGERSSLDIRATFLDAPAARKQLATGA
ncbi:MAG TPA: patatin-like phospholipase family protein [Stellaceae bacterium]|jgi:NTE family protein|nr:patatin-like phospholipase family protein [Stellaceae bacterium]